MASAVSSGLAAQFQQSGLGDQVHSWIGSGQNLPISPDQIQSVLGSPMIASIAAKFGIDPTMATQLLSQHLPGLVDHMTPAGAIPGTTEV